MLRTKRRIVALPVQFYQAWALRIVWHWSHGMFAWLEQPLRFFEHFQEWNKPAKAAKFPRKVNPVRTVDDISP